MSEISDILNAEKFFALEKQLIAEGLGSDLHEFAEVKRRLVSPPHLSPDDFAREVFYVILAGGFSQKTAKKLWVKICAAIDAGDRDLYAIFKNKNKTNAILKVWDNREKFRDGFYTLSSAADKLAYLATIPHIGAVTANHLARNLGISVVKYDVWIQRLVSGQSSFPVQPEVKELADKMFARLEEETGLPRGYIDVVLWKACQVGLIKL